jgi:hypothetical protein
MPDQADEWFGGDAPGSMWCQEPNLGVSAETRPAITFDATAA